MNYKNFKEILKIYKKINKDLSELHDIGLNLFDGKYEISGGVERLLFENLKSQYNEIGIEWIEWFIYENKYGEAKMEAYETVDNNKVLICQNTLELWKYIDKYKLRVDSTTDKAYKGE